MMNSKLLAIFQLVLGIGEEIVPIFVHNPKSEKIEAVVVTTANGVMSALSPPAKTP